MEPATKRRRLAPKVPDPPAQAQPQSQAQHQQALPPPASAQPAPLEQQSSPHYASQDAHAPAPPERHEFEAFARHLQDAAIHIYRQAQASAYASVSVLLLRWEDDVSVEQDLIALEKVFRERYNYHTDKWQIPTVPNPSIKLSAQMALFQEQARPDHLLIIYYAGYGFVGSDNQLYWACNSREDAAKLRWDGVRCLFEDAVSDILLLLDTCAVSDAPMAGSHGIKQAIAAYSPDQKTKDSGAPSFTASLVESLQKLGTSGRPFSIQRLHEQVMFERQQEAAQSKLINGASKNGPTPPRSPVCFTLTPGKGQSLSLAPLAPKVPKLQPSSPQSTEADGHSPRLGREDQAADPGVPADLAFDEPRVLVCTTFVGDANPDMLFFTQWLHSTPPLASKLAVEGMFLGPPTVLLISMPHEIWNVVQHDKVCCFLGFIRSHNMLHLYQRLLSSTSVTKAMAKEVADGRILLEAREAATNSPGMLKREAASHVPALLPETPARSSQAGAPSSAVHDGARRTAEAKDEVEETAEMKEAAEQLKQLSNPRHRSDEGGASATLDRHGAAQTADNIDVRHDKSVSPPADENEYGADEKLYDGSGGGSGGGGGGGGGDSGGGAATPTKLKARRLLQKQPMKQETRCNHCSHAPFKDSSTLRKHIAAAHTRPFPCAFSFAGCLSTFGSKNEWKRHIASQHMCLVYYRCSQCPQGAAEGKGNEFNRKDLFTQHLRRMHAPQAVKKVMGTVGGGGAGAGGGGNKAADAASSKVVAEWEAQVRDLQCECRIYRRQPPDRSACPKPGCQSVFEGNGAWDDWTEHVGRHLEKGEAQPNGVDHLMAQWAQPMGLDPLLTQWALEEGIIERKEDGGYRLCAGNGIGGGGESKSERDKRSALGKSNGDSSFVSETGQSREDDDPSITVAVSLPDSTNMDVDD